MFEGMRRRWVETGRPARTGLVVGVLAIVLLVGAALYAVWRTDYQTLFSDLDPQDAASIVAELDRMKVPYRLAGDGTAVLVDRNQVHATRLKLLGKGGLNLRGGVGFEIFNNSD